MTAGNSGGTAKAKAKPRGKPFAKGQSGNPNGRPKVPAEVRDAARAHTMLAIETLVSVCKTADSDNARVSAANALLDRAWGKPTQEISGPGGAAIPIEISEMPEGELVARAAVILAKKGTK